MRVQKLAAGAAAALLIATGVASAGPLTYNNVNLESMGIYKSVELPGNPQTGLYGSTFDTGFHQLPIQLQSGTLLLIPIQSMTWASGTQDSSGHKVPGVGGISSTAELIRPFTILPQAMQPADPHYKLGFDMFIPAMVTVHSDTGAPVGTGVGGSGLGDISAGPSLLLLGFGNSFVQASGDVEVLFDLPTGSYNAQHIFNVGSNEVALSAFAIPILTFPTLNNLYSDTLIEYTHTISGNNDFVVAGSSGLNQLLTGKPSGNYSTGDLFTFNTDLLYPVLPDLAIGPSLAIEDQTTNDSWNGSTVHNSGQFAAGAGAGFQYRRPGINFQVKYITTFSAENMPRYNIIWAQLSLPFAL